MKTQFNTSSFFIKFFLIIILLLSVFASTGASARNETVNQDTSHAMGDLLSQPTPEDPEEIPEVISPAGTGEGMGDEFLGSEIEEEDTSGETQSPPMPERETRSINEDLIVVVDVVVDNEEIRNDILEMGYPCEELGICQLEISQNEISKLKEKGFDYTVVDQAVVVRPSPESSLAEESVYGSNVTDIPIPDYDTACGWGWSYVNLAGAPTGSVVTRVEYRVRVLHTYPGDLIIQLTNQQGEIETLWNRLGGTDDGGYDDDVEDDEDIYLNYRWVDATFDGDNVNQYWYLDVFDCASGDVGNIDYFELWVYYESAGGEPNLTPYTVSGWDFPIVPSSQSGTNTVNQLCADGTTYIDFAVINNGDATASGSFYNALYFDGSHVVSGSASDLLSNYYLYYEDWVLNITPTEGWHNLRLVADYQGVIAESNELDNEWDADFYWDICDSQIDLVAADIYWTPSNPAELDGITLTGIVTNNGNADSGSFFNSIYLQGIELCTWYVSSLGSGQSSQYDCYIGALLSGDYFVSVEADIYGDVSESNEGNNYYNEVMTVFPSGDPDIRVVPDSLHFTYDSTTAGIANNPQSNSPNFNSYGSIKNPASAYCVGLGYDSGIVTAEDGSQHNVCKLPDGVVCDGWDFYAGKCGQEYSYCALQGLNTVTLKDGQNQFSSEYAACVDEHGNIVGSASEMMDLSDLVSGDPGIFDRYEGPPEPPMEFVDAAPPPAFDWRNYLGGDWTTPVKDQENCGSCWAFSAVGVSEAVLNIAANSPDLDLDLSEEYLVTDCAVYEGSCAGGYKGGALYYIRDNGIPDEACLPYLEVDCTYTALGTCNTSTCTYNTGDQCSDFQCSDRCGDWASRLQTIDSVTNMGYDPSIETIKTALIDHGPIAVSMNMGGTFSGGIYTCSDNTSTGHAVIVVGYDDAGGYWIVKNSWGDTWDGDGFYNVAYDNCAIQKYPYYADASAVSGFTIFNDGAGDLQIDGVSIVGSSCWLDISPPQTPPFTIAPGGSETVGVTVDHSCIGDGFYQDTIRINSNDPDENPVDVPVTFDVTISYPDLEVTYIEWLPVNPSEVDEITLTGTMTNIGDADSGDFVFAFWLNGVLQNNCSWVYGNLTSGESIPTPDCVIGILDAGDYDVELIVDVNQQVDESDETNNQLVEIMTVSLIPTLTTLRPSSTIAGGPDFILTVLGTNFIDGVSTVRWNGADRVTKFLSDTRLAAKITATDIATEGTASVTVFNNGPGGGESNTLTFSIITNAIPTLMRLRPDSAAAGDPIFILTVIGTNFIDTISTIRWNGAERPTKFVSDTRLRTKINASDIASAGTAAVTVFNSGIGGGESNTLIFTITGDTPAPEITALTPDSAFAGDPGFMITVTGTGFINHESVVRWDGSDRPTVFISSTELQAWIGAPLLATAGDVNVTVFNSGPGGGESNTVFFTINP